MYKIPADLKASILEIPQKEKDKLLLRLLAKDELLCEKLRFEYLEEKSTLEFRREELRKECTDWINRLVREKHLNKNYFAFKCINSNLATYIKITKDNYGEIDIMTDCLMIFFEKNKAIINDHNYYNSYDFYNYLCTKLIQILKKIEKLHPDIQLDFHVKINQLLSYAHQLGTKENAEYLNLKQEFEIDYSKVK
ncbi:MAG: hypothetical protein KA313_08745 [Pseudarcicella sp.]|jgi:hypothetical protein|nr:hypothetical protein [Pseudarcicella sp.]MBP6411171.1 hypothetical protein [Pseudarcicella sp.]